MAMVELKRPFRQQGDPQFLDILNRIRDNSLSLMDVDRLNVACGIRNPWAYERRSNLDTPPPPPIELTSTNEMAHAVNREQLATIDAPVFAYEAYTTGQFDTKLFPTEGVLRLKVGAQVMLIRNDKEGGYVNGSIGKVVHLAKDEIVVDIDGEECDIERVKWDRLSYDLDAQTQMMTTRSMGTFEQYPIRLGWAVTIHKSQGQTFDRVIVDFGRGAFAHGQAYVALSRCRTMSGLRLRTSFKMSDVQFDDRILEFHKQFDTGQV
jgi:ATP-dependent exoDNAse (exonuclease V) alpha subunit